jgi:hypothetical protein
MSVCVYMNTAGASPGGILTPGQPNHKKKIYPSSTGYKSRVSTQKRLQRGESMRSQSFMLWTNAKPKSVKNILTTWRRTIQKPAPPYIIYPLQHLIVFFYSLRFSIFIVVLVCRGGRKLDWEWWHLIHPLCIFIQSGLDIRPADAHTVRPVHDVTKESPNYTHLFSFCV